MLARLRDNDRFGKAFTLTSASCPQVWQVAITALMPVLAHIRQRRRPPWLFTRDRPLALPRRLPSSKAGPAVPVPFPLSWRLTIYG